MRFTANSIPTAATAGNVGQRSGFGEDALVIGLVDGDDVVGAEFFAGVDASDFAHFLMLP